jgi:hypothetical protein
VLYISNEFNSLGNNAPLVIAAASSKDFQFNFDATQIPYEWNTCFIAVSSVDKENNESKISNPVQLVKTNNIWAIPK